MAMGPHGGMGGPGGMPMGMGRHGQGGQGGYNGGRQGGYNGNNNRGGHG